MTYYNPPPNPYDPTLNYTSAPLPRRPTVITVLAIIGIVEGILWLMCGGFGLIANAASFFVGHNVFMASASLPRAMAIVGAFEALIWLILAIVLLWACIAALSLKPWVPRAIMPWSVATIVFFIIQFSVQAVWIGPYSMAIAKRTQPNNPAIAMGTYFMMCGGVLMLLVYCAAGVLSDILAK